MGRCSRRQFIKRIGTGCLATALVPATGWSALLPDGTRRSLD
ncbi:twin-arginine translocation signal domain-containing protein, partial [Desulfosarcina sp.]